VTGVLHPLPLSPAIDRSALVGWPVAEDLLGFDGHPTTVYERSSDQAVTSVRSVLAATADPEHPDQVAVSRPSDALTAELAAASAFSALFLGLGAVALVVGGVGIANIMVISLLGGVAGVAAGLATTLGYAAWQDWPLVLPGQTLAGGVLAALCVGALAGLYPARRAARLAPTQALATG
jgi:putative ABC transport system permease protein